MLNPAPNDKRPSIYLDGHLNQKRQVSLKTCADVYDYWRTCKRRYKKSPKDGVEFQIDYIDTGHLIGDQQQRAEAPIALALHGAPGSYHDFSLLIHHLSQQKVRVIAPNFPEYTATVRTKVLFRHSADEKAAYLRDFLKAINVNKIDLLVSHSSAIFPTLLILLNANGKQVHGSTDEGADDKPADVATNKSHATSCKGIGTTTTTETTTTNTGKSSDCTTTESSITAAADKDGHDELSHVPTLDNDDDAKDDEDDEQPGSEPQSIGHCSVGEIGRDNGNNNHDDELIAQSQPIISEAGSSSSCSTRSTLTALDREQLLIEQQQLDGNNNDTPLNNNANSNSTTKLTVKSRLASRSICKSALQQEETHPQEQNPQVRQQTKLHQDRIIANDDSKGHAKGKGARRSDQDVIVKFEQPIKIKAVALFNPAGHRLPKSMKPTWFKCGSVRVYQHKLGRYWFRKLGPAFLTIIGVPVRVDNMDNVMLSATVMRNSKCHRVTKQLKQLSEMKLPTLLVFSENDKLIEKEIFYEMTQQMGLDKRNFDIFNNDGDLELSQSRTEDWIRVMVFKAGGHYAYSNYAKTVNKAVDVLLEKVTKKP